MIRKNKVSVPSKNWQYMKEPDTKVEKAEPKVTRSNWERSENVDSEIDKVEARIPRSNWDQLSGIQSPKVIRAFRGVNRLNPLNIEDEFATSTKNLTASNFPSISVREGYSAKGNALLAKILGLGARKNRDLVTVSNGEMFVYDAATNSWVSKVIGLSTTKPWSFVNFRGNFTDIHLLASNGVDAVKKFDGTTVSDLLNAPINLNYICTHANRLYGSVASTLRFSALRKGEDWTTAGDAGEIVVETADGKHITGVVAGLGRLVIFKDNSIHELYGTGPHNYQMKAVSDRVGTPTGHSAQVVDGVLYFLDKDGIYQYTGGNAPRNDFSLGVQEYIKGINMTYIDRSVSGTDGIRYYLVVPHGASTEPNLMFEYDTRFDTWNVWELPSPVTSPFVTTDEGLFGGLNSGVVLKQGGGTDNGTAIGWEWISKPFSFGSLATKNRWYRLWLVVDLPTGSTLDVYLSDKAEGSTWTKVHALSANADLQTSQVLIPVNQVFHSQTMRVRLVGSGPCKVHELTRQERVFPMGGG